MRGAVDVECVEISLSMGSKLLLPSLQMTSISPSVWSGRLRILPQKLEAEKHKTTKSCGEWMWIVECFVHKVSQSCKTYPQGPAWYGEWGEEGVGRYEVEGGRGRCGVEHVITRAVWVASTQVMRMFCRDYVSLFIWYECWGQWEWCISWQRPVMFLSLDPAIKTSLSSPPGRRLVWSMDNLW